MPKQYVLGLDSQKKDFEHYGQKSYLRGEWRKGGWWYYYFYGLMVKVPCGTWGLRILVVISRLRFRDRVVRLRDELVVLAPAVTLLIVASCQTEFTVHLRYVFPTLGLNLVFLGQAGLLLVCGPWGCRLAAATLLSYSVATTLVVYPNHFAYFNEFAGGPRNGHKHLLGSSLDWGQDWLRVAKEAARRGQTINMVQPVPLDYSLMLNNLRPVSIQELRAGTPDQAAVSSWTEPLAKAVDAGEVRVQGRKYSLFVVTGRSPGQGVE